MFVFKRLAVSPIRGSSATIDAVRTNRPFAAGDVPDTGVPPALAADMSIDERYDWHQAFLRRHPVSRRGFLSGSAAAAAVAALGLSPFGSRAYAEDAPLAVANRRVGYGSDAASQLRLAAQLSRNPGSVKVFVDHGPTPELGATAQAEIRNLVTQIPDSHGGVLPPNSSTPTCRSTTCPAGRRSSTGGVLPTDSSATSARRPPRCPAAATRWLRSGSP